MKTNKTEIIKTILLAFILAICSITFSLLSFITPSLFMRIELIISGVVVMIIDICFIFRAIDKFI